MSGDTHIWTEGWGFPYLSKKAHWFIESRSLCGKWMYMGVLHPDLFESPDDCAACRRKLEPRKAKEAKRG